MTRAVAWVLALALATEGLRYFGDDWVVMMAFAVCSAWVNDPPLPDVSLVWQCDRGGWHNDARPGACSRGGYHPTPDRRG